MSVWCARATRATTVPLAWRALLAGRAAATELTTYDGAIVALQALKPRLVIQRHGAPGHPDPPGHTLELLTSSRASAD